ncbi:uncharacterized protein LOC110349909 [Heterocephalus glaber]|uniref:Uncharacterized protein LOC110349909 n=1 Tax=Heterocephalus glaber TaxID=10181 RepID=A0AAX6T4N5_HETGA|nr:uncharacterized protein LOC110349909 [Heterocephalus glaber]
MPLFASFLRAARSARSLAEEGPGSPSLLFNQVAVLFTGTLATAQAPLQTVGTAAPNPTTVCSGVSEPKGRGWAGLRLRYCHGDDKPEAALAGPAGGEGCKPAETGARRSALDGWNVEKPWRPLQLTLLGSLLAQVVVGSAPERPRPAPLAPASCGRAAPPRPPPAPPAVATAPRANGRWQPACAALRGLAPATRERPRPVRPAAEESTQFITELLCWLLEGGDSENSEDPVVQPGLAWNFTVLLPQHPECLHCRASEQCRDYSVPCVIVKRPSVQRYRVTLSRSPHCWLSQVWAQTLCFQCQVINFTLSLTPIGNASAETPHSVKPVQGIISVRQTAAKKTFTSVSMGFRLWPVKTQSWKNTCQNRFSTRRWSL